METLEALDQSLKDQTSPKLNFKQLLQVLQSAYDADKKSIAKGKEDVYSPTTLAATDSVFLKTLKAINKLFIVNGVNIEASKEDLAASSKMLVDLFVHQIPNPKNTAACITEEDFEEYNCFFQSLVTVYTSLIKHINASHEKLNLRCPHSFMLITPLFKVYSEINTSILNEIENEEIVVSFLQEWNIALLNLIHFLLSMHRDACLIDIDVLKILDLIETYRCNRQMVQTCITQNKKYSKRETEKQIESDKETQVLMITLTGKKPRNDFYLLVWLLISDMDKFKVQLLTKYKASTKEECLKNAIANGDYEHVVLIITYLEPNHKKDIVHGKNCLEFAIDELINLLSKPLTEEDKTKLRQYLSIVKLLSNMSITNRRLTEYESKLATLPITLENKIFVDEFTSFIALENLRFVQKLYSNSDEIKANKLPSIETCMQRVAIAGRADALKTILVNYHSAYHKSLSNQELSNILCQTIDATINVCKDFNEDKTQKSMVVRLFDVIQLLDLNGATVFPEKAGALLESLAALSTLTSLSQFKESIAALDALIRRNQMQEIINNNQLSVVGTNVDAQTTNPLSDIKGIPQRTITSIMAMLDENGAKDDVNKLTSLLKDINEQFKKRKLFVIDMSTDKALTAFSESIMHVLTQCLKDRAFKQFSMLMIEYLSMTIKLIESHKLLQLPKPSQFVDIEALFEEFRIKNAQETIDQEKVDVAWANVVSQLVKCLIVLDVNNYLIDSALIMILDILEDRRQLLKCDTRLQVLLESKCIGQTPRHQFYQKLWLYVSDRDKYAVALQQQYFVANHDKTLPDYNLCLRRAAQQGNLEDVVMLTMQFKVNIHCTTSSKPNLNSSELAAEKWITLLQESSTAENIEKVATYCKIVIFLSKLGVENAMIAEYERRLPALKQQVDVTRFQPFNSYVKAQKLLKLQEKYHITTDGDNVPTILTCLCRASLASELGDVNTIITYYQEAFDTKIPEDELSVILYIVLKQMMALLEKKYKDKPSVSVKKQDLQQVNAYIESIRLLIDAGTKLQSMQQTELADKFKLIMTYVPAELKQEISFLGSMLTGNQQQNDDRLIADNTTVKTTRLQDSLKEVKELENEFAALQRKKVEMMNEKQQITEKLDKKIEERKKLESMVHNMEENKNKKNASTSKKQPVNQMDKLQHNEELAKKREEAELKKQEAMNRKKKAEEERLKQEALLRQQREEDEKRKQALQQKQKEEAEKRKQEAQLKAQKEREEAALRKANKNKKKKKQLQPECAIKREAVVGQSVSLSIFKRSVINTYKSEVAPAAELIPVPFEYHVNGVTVKTSRLASTDGKYEDHAFYELDDAQAKSLKGEMSNLIHYQIHALIEHLFNTTPKPVVYYIGGCVAHYLSKKLLPFNDIDLVYFVAVDTLNDLAKFVERCDEWLRKYNIKPTSILVNHGSFQAYLLQFTHNGKEYDFNFVRQKDEALYFNPYCNLKSAYYNYHTHVLHDMQHAIGGFAQSKLKFNLNTVSLAPIDIYILIVKLMNEKTKWTIEHKDYQVFLSSLSGEFETASAKAAEDFYYKRFKKIAKYIALPAYKEKLIFLMDHFKDSFKVLFKFDDKQFKQFLYLVSHLIYAKNETSDAHERDIAKILDKIYRIVKGECNDPYIQKFMEKHPVTTLLEYFSEDMQFIKAFPIPYEILPLQVQSNPSIVMAPTLFATQGNQSVQSISTSASNNNAFIPRTQ